MWMLYRNRVRGQRSGCICRMRMSQNCDRCCDWFVIIDRYVKYKHKRSRRKNSGKLDGRNTGIKEILQAR